MMIFLVTMTVTLTISVVMSIKKMYLDARARSRRESIRLVEDGDETK
jgi:hypothetical protein